MLANKVKDSQELMSLALDNRRDLLGHDPTFGIELALCGAIAGPEAEARISAVVLGLFPSAEKFVTVDETMEAVRKFVNHDGFKLIPVALQTATKYALTLCGAIKKCQTTGLKVKGMSKLVREMWLRCGYYCCVKVSCLLSGCCVCVLCRGGGGGAPYFW